MDQPHLSKQRRVRGSVALSLAGAALMLAACARSQVQPLEEAIRADAGELPGAVAGSGGDSAAPMAGAAGTVAVAPDARVPSDAGLDAGVDGAPGIDAATPDAGDGGGPGVVDADVEGGTSDGCTPGQRRCTNAWTPSFCDVNGNWFHLKVCEAPSSLCQGGFCWECTDDGTLDCGPDGTVRRCEDHNWVVVESCAAGLSCIDGACACVPDPVPFRCLDETTPQFCSDEGRLVNAEACAGERPRCLDGSCVACTPSTTLCIDADSLERCHEGGVSRPEPCPRQTTCVATSCRAPVRALTAGYGFACAILEGGRVKCWGANIGNLGLGDSQPRGAEPGQMGLNLPFVDLGTGRTAVAVDAGEAHVCALLDNGQVKCWGDAILGLGDPRPRGVNPGEMGDALPAISLGTDRTAVAISAGMLHTCAVLDNGQLKCWGDNEYASLGLGDTAARGDEPGEMGDSLPAVDLGTGRTALAVAAGYITCALRDDGQVVCWGDNEYGMLGLGRYGGAIGDEPGEMGDSLVPVDLGAGRTATDLWLDGGHPCALLDNGALKCWGTNEYGELGLGSLEAVGDEPGEMGDALPAVDLGAGRAAVAGGASVVHTCALLDSAQVKCWGANDLGQLGLGSQEPAHGDQPNEMGDTLSTVDLGAGRSALAVAVGYMHTCALLDSHQVKCWGENGSGDLGIGDLRDRGRYPAEMGDALPSVDLGY